LPRNNEYLFTHLTYLLNLLLYLYRACNKVTQLSIPTHAQLEILLIKIYLKFHKKHSYMFRSYDHHQGGLKILAKITTSLIIYNTLYVPVLKNWRYGSMSCYVCWVILGEHLSVRVIASAV